MDGMGDACDTCTDTDGDRLANPGFPASIDCLPIDNCPDEYNPGQADADGDGTGDTCDICTDTDDDGFADPGFPASTCPLDNCPTIGNPTQADADADGTGDACDSCTDTDGDGFANSGFPASTDCLPADNCPDDPNAGQADADADGIGDVCDMCTDTDGDGFGDPGFSSSTCLIDNCATIGNPGQADADVDGVGDACDTCTDTDGDGFANSGFPVSIDCLPIDNCPDDDNPDQADADGDGTGDACDTCTDIDGDGFASPGFPSSSNCLPVDNCPLIPNSDQLDANGNGTGDVCECAALSPGRCIAGGGSKITDCLVEFNTTGPIRLNRKRTKVKRQLRCRDGDVPCDRDGRIDGYCTFGVTLCLGNDDPRLARRCQPSKVTSVEIKRPRADALRSSIDRDNAFRLEQSLSAVGLGIRRHGEIFRAGSETPPEMNTCSPLVELVVPAPAGRRDKPVKRKLRVLGYAADGRRDKDKVVLKCAAPEQP
jgi:hypothetical protein